MGIEISLRPATTDDLPRLDAIRAAAFAPVFASFRSILGDTIYETAQRRDDEAQGDLLRSLFAPDSVWEVWAAEDAAVEGRAAEDDDEVVGFVSIRIDRETGVGEIGLNAVDPTHAGRGVGTAMYEHALARMREEGLRVATVGTGGDPSHAPARRAYQKAGFDVEIPSVWMCRQL